MKVFLVAMEYSSKERQEILTQKQYVTSSDDSIATVTNFYINYAKQYEMNLISIQEILTVVRHIEPDPL